MLNVVTSVFNGNVRFEIAVPFASVVTIATFECRLLSALDSQVVHKASLVFIPPTAVTHVSLRIFSSRSHCNVSTFNEHDILT